MSPLVLALFLAAPAAAQTPGLADVARQEEARRKAVRAAGKVYTNADLRPDAPGVEAEPATPGDDPESTAPAPKAAPETTAPAVGGPAGKAEEPPPQKTQAYWTERIAAARGALERSRIFADALQSRINAFAADIINRDDPAQRSQLELERQRALDELARVRKEIEEQTKAIADIQEDARKAGVPPGWLR